MSLSLNKREYIELVAMMNESAANYELPREGWREGGDSRYSGRLRRIPAPGRVDRSFRG